MLNNIINVFSEIGKNWRGEKLVVGIDIDEILRAKWLQFDRFYVEEFGMDGVPRDEPYVFDYFKNYKWENIVEIEKELKEPDEMPDNINPIDYQVDKKTGDAPADLFLFKKSEEVKLTPKEVYNRFLYEDYLFEIYGAATMMYKGMDVHLTKFYEKYGEQVDFVLISRENRQTIPPTLFFLSKILSRFQHYRFVETYEEMWNYVDILITTNPDILDAGTPDEKDINKHVIKILRPYNKDCQDGSLGLEGRDILQLNDLIDNKKFQKIIKYRKKTKKK